MDISTLLGEPTIKFCEDNIAGFIAQPANAYSSLIISLAGMYLLLQRTKRLFSSWLGWIAILVGLTSFAYHASFTFIGQLMDLGSMFLLASFLIIASLRKRKLPLMRQLSIVVIGTLLPLIATVLLRTIGGFNIGIPLFALMLLIAVWLEMRVAKEEKRSLYIYGLAFLLFIGGWLIWLLDYRQIWCSPSYFHILNGHAIWHIANGAVLLVLDHYYGRTQ